VDYYFDPPTTVEPALQTGVSALGSTSLTRWPSLPGVRTLNEQGFLGFDVTTWFGLVAPAGTPADRVRLLNEKLIAIMKDPEVVKALQNAGFVIQVLGPQQFEQKIAQEDRNWTRTIKEAGIAPAAGK
jgi:tripartite-type tricarboxylate transporter receptor subunit TctC